MRSWREVVPSMPCLLFKVFCLKCVPARSTSAVRAAEIRRGVEGHNLLKINVKKKHLKEISN